MINAVKKSNLKTLLTESASDRSFSALAKDINVQVSVFDPLERRDATAAEDYLSTMRRNLKNLETAFIEKNPQLK